MAILSKQAQVEGPAEQPRAPQQLPTLLDHGVRKQAEVPVEGPGEQLTVQDRQQLRRLPVLLGRERNGLGARPEQTSTQELPEQSCRQELSNLEVAESTRKAVLARFRRR
eukprot:TRINITY_DN78911_c0_g1_i1.p1 TRINITY_DN78911_c0_g1~~TRINITY_DN78911_c0_g1_i1.p1  ORF type:complete len:110 (+),score=20.91 TRINITY_DN78911_c0_g1_i1:117-446(+)